MGGLSPQLVKNKKIVILKNDRGGDLLISHKAISYLMTLSEDITIFLSNINKNFSFLFKNIKILEFPFDLKIKHKINLFIYLLKNKVDEVYILSPKGFYYYLPIFFRKIKFFAIVIDGKKRNRPSIFLRKFLYKYEIINRINKINKISSSELQFKLVKTKNEYKINKLNLLPNNSLIRKYLKEDFIFFQFKKTFFEKIAWNKDKINNFINFLASKNKNIVFCSDIEITEYNAMFLSKYSSINFDENKFNNKKNNNILYCHNITGEDLFYVISLSKKVISPHGLISHISWILKKPTLALFNFDIKNKDDLLHEKISFSEWYPKKSFDFAFLNKDFEKALKKINTRI